MATKKKPSRPAFLLRCTPRQLAAFRRAAKRENLPLATWARTALLDIIDARREPRA